VCCFSGPVDQVSSTLPVHLARSQGLVDGDAPVKRNLLAGRHPNQDVWVART
jgi:hypothetical protein